MTLNKESLPAKISLMLFFSMTVLEVVFVLLSDFKLNMERGLLILASVGLFALATYSAFDFIVVKPANAFAHFKSQVWQLSQGFFLMVVLNVLFYLIYANIGDVGMHIANFSVLLIFAAIVNSLMQEVWEEIIFRGFVQKFLMKAGRAIRLPFTPAFVIMTQALLFSCLHPISHPWYEDLSNILFHFSSAVIFGLLYFKSGNLWLSIGAHIGINTFQGIVGGVEQPPLFYIQGILYGMDGGRPFHVAWLCLFALFLFIYAISNVKNRWLLSASQPPIAS